MTTASNKVAVNKAGSVGSGANDMATLLNRFKDYTNSAKIHRREHICNLFAIAASFLFFPVHITDSVKDPVFADWLMATLYSVSAAFLFAVFIYWATFALIYLLAGAFSSTASRASHGLAKLVLVAAVIGAMWWPFVEGFLRTVNSSVFLLTVPFGGG